VELIPNIAPVLADALATAKMVTIAGGGGGAAESAMGNISSVLQTVLAVQLVTRGGLLGETDDGQKG
jgi:flotillin